ncbi:MAG: hypothetical protein JOZ81_14395 [Chloroflexi bacterium]|nr:hypothetical protein [Chloroflexota bacterium]MBV9543381.1 hypothetical protein [Chloroflexota bacterium]
MPSSPPPDRFQREIDDIIRLAERRLEHQSFSYRMRKSTRRLSNAVGGFSLRLPAPEALGGWGLALLFLSMVISVLMRGGPVVFGIGLGQLSLAIGALLLALALITSVLRGRGPQSSSTGGSKMWRGERIAYGSPYGETWVSRIRRILRGR